MQHDFNNVPGYIHKKCMCINVAMQVFLLRSKIPVNNGNFQENVLAKNANHSEPAVEWGRNGELCT